MMIVDSTTVLIIVAVFVSINSFLIGYIVGSNNKSLGVENVGSTLFNKSRSQNSKTNITNNPTIDIDESKVVVSIETDNLERKYTKLGEVKTSNENITNSIDRLKNLKK